MHRCVQEKSWMENHVMSICKEKLRYPYIQGTSKPALPLDSMGSHMHSCFINAVDERENQVIQIPGSFTSVCQPFDVGIMMPFKTQLAGMCQGWKVSRYSNMGASGKIATPRRIDVLEWVNSIWNEFSPEIIKNSFWKCGFTDDVNLIIDSVLEMISIY